MAFKLNCDRCDKFIKNISADKLRDMIGSKKEVICKDCQATEDLLQKFVNNIRQKAQRDFEDTANKYKTLIKEEIAKVITRQDEGE